MSAHTAAVANRPALPKRFKGELPRERTYSCRCPSPLELDYKSPCYTSQVCTTALLHQSMVYYSPATRVQLQPCTATASHMRCECSRMWIAGSTIRATHPHEFPVLVQHRHCQTIDLGLHHPAERAAVVASGGDFRLGQPPKHALVPCARIVRRVHSAEAQHRDQVAGLPERRRRWGALHTHSRSAAHTPPELTW
eukprot:194754-Chlamydomonas_euryale.AAC.3